MDSCINTSFHSLNHCPNRHHQWLETMRADTIWQYTMVENLFKFASFSSVFRFVLQQAFSRFNDRKRQLWISDDVSSQLHVICFYFSLLAVCAVVVVIATCWNTATTEILWATPWMVWVRSVKTWMVSLKIAEAALIRSCMHQSICLRVLFRIMLHTHVRSFARSPHWQIEQYEMNEEKDSLCAKTQWINSAGFEASNCWQKSCLTLSRWAEHELFALETMRKKYTNNLILFWVVVFFILFIWRRRMWYVGGRGVIALADGGITASPRSKHGEQLLEIEANINVRKHTSVVCHLLLSITK